MIRYVLLTFPSNWHTRSQTVWSIKCWEKGANKIESCVTLGGGTAQSVLCHREFVFFLFPLNKVSPLSFSFGSESERRIKVKGKVREMPRTRALGRECWPLAGIYHWWSQFHHFLAAKRTLCHRGSQWWGPRWCWEGIWAVLGFGKTTIRRKTVPPIDPNFYDTRVPSACWAQIR